jgi:hypothetical protein
MDYPGGFITKTAPTLNPALGNAAPGVWRLNDVLKNIKAGTWPSYDPYFENTTLLLHGNGTNGGQNNTFLDSSTNNFTITRNGNTTQGTFSPFSQTGWSLGGCTGSSDYLQMGSSAALQLGTGDFTVECWAYFTTVGSSGGSENVIMDVRPTGTNGAYFNFGLSNQTVYWDNGTGSSPYPLVSPTISLNAWVHIAIVRSSGTSRLYINGTSVASVSDSVNYSCGSTNRIANLSYFSSGDRKFNGNISNLRIVKGTAVYTAAFTPPTAPLTAISGTTLLTLQSNRWIDNSSSALPISVNGAPTVQAFSPFAPTAAYSASTVGGSGYFDGTGDYLTFPDSASFDYSTGDFTCDMWVYPTTVSGDKVLLQLGSYGSGQTGIVFLLSNGGKVFYGYNGGFGGESSGSVLINTWSYLSFVRSSGTLKMYVNGVEKYSTSFTSSIAPSTDFSIGSNLNPSGSQFSGYLTSVRLSNTARSSSVPTTPITNDGNTSLLLNFTNAAIIDNTAKNVLETVDNAQISTTQSKFGGASLAFDGSGDWLAGPPTPQTDLGSGDFTIEAWLYRTASGAASDSGIVSRGAPTTLNGFVFGYTSANVLVFSFNYSGAIVTGVTVIPANTWTHVAVSRNGNTFRLFVNGVLDATATSTNSQTTNAGDIFYVGRSGYDSGRIVTGYLDDVRITKGIARYTSNFTPQTSQWQDQ